MRRNLQALAGDSEAAACRSKMRATSPNEWAKRICDERDIKVDIVRQKSLITEQS